MQSHRRTLALTAAVLGASVLLGCIGVSAQRRNPDGTIAPPRYCARGTEIGADGLIDDLEDGNNSLDATAGRGGYWWKSADPTGSVIGPDDFNPQVNEGETSRAIRAIGETASGGGDDNWGVQFGADFSTTPGYDASKYVGIRFRAKIGANSTRSVRFKVADVNTHPKMGVCTACWNHFGRDLNLTEEWQDFEFFFAALEQAPYWGDPRPASITPAKLYGFDFQVGPGNKFDIFVDDLAFIECK